MKLIFKPDGALWIINRSESEPDVEGCTSLIVSNAFNPIESEVEGVSIYKTLVQVQTELAD